MSPIQPVAAAFGTNDRNPYPPTARYRFVGTKRKAAEPSQTIYLAPDPAGVLGVHVDVLA